jgi:hypothetical protein
MLTCRGSMHLPVLFRQTVKQPDHMQYLVTQGVVFQEFQTAVLTWHGEGLTSTPCMPLAPISGGAALCLIVQSGRTGVVYHVGMRRRAMCDLASRGGHCRRVQAGPARAQMQDDRSAAGARQLPSSAPTGGSSDSSGRAPALSSVEYAWPTTGLRLM